MSAVGVDLGGTKIEAQVYGPDWSVIARRRVDTPPDYTDLLAAISGLVVWAETVAGDMCPVGIASAGAVNRATGVMTAANLAAHGKRFPADLCAALDRPVPLLNDARALTLAEARFGAGVGAQSLLAVVMGTGMGGGVAIGGALAPMFAGVGGEFGHMALPASVVAALDLPLLPCGCGRTGCVETILSGPGLARLAMHRTGQEVTPDEAIADPALRAVWIAVLAEVLFSLILAHDPQVIVLGGGLSGIDGLVPEAARALATVAWPGFAMPQLAVATQGGAKGAAWAAVQGITA